MTRKTPSNSPSKPSSKLTAMVLARVVRAGLLGLAMALTIATPAAFAQSLGRTVSQILTIDRERLFQDSAFGARVQAELELERAQLAKETRQIEAALEEEERALTLQRDSLTPEAFRALADAFDLRVQDLRQTSIVTEQDFLRRMEREQLAFFDRIGPILGQLVRELGAVVIVDHRVIILTTQNVDVTDLAITRIDAELGTGESAPADGPADAPADGPAEAPAEAPTETPAAPSSD